MRLDQSCLGAKPPAGCLGAKREALDIGGNKSLLTEAQKKFPSPGPGPGPYLHSKITGVVTDPKTGSYVSNWAGPVTGPVTNPLVISEMCFAN